MPAIVVSGVNTGTDTLTAVAHGLLTGDRFRVRNVGGALPTGLTATVDVFAVTLTADTLKVGASSAAALAGTPVIDITAGGSGTTTIEYGLPYCIPTALAAVGTQIKSANDNGAWNALVALYDLLTAQAQSVWTTIVIAVTVTFNALVTFAAGIALAANQHVTLSGTGEVKHGSRVRTIAPVGWAFTNAANWATTIDVSSAYIRSVAADNVLFALPVKTGDRLTACSYAAFGNAAVDATAFLLIANGDSSAAGSTIASVTDTNHAASWSDVALAGPFTTHVMAVGEIAILQIVPNAANYRIGRILLTYDRP